MFNAKALCRYLKETKPPYKCPAGNCGKTFKSFTGAKVHLYKSHNRRTKEPKAKRKETPVGADNRNRFIQNVNENVQFADTGSAFEVVIDGQAHQININDSLDLVQADEFKEGLGNDINEYSLHPEEAISCVPSDVHVKNRKVVSSVAVKQPESSFRVVENYDPPNAAFLPSSYYVHDESLGDELCKEVEYDMDDEDVAWLCIMNEKQKKLGLREVTEDIFELLMDCLEKESYFRCQAIAEETLASIDENAVCCICNDGDCDDSNAILFCDMCNLPVHQECYGVPYIPEGQWLCRRCTYSPSCFVECVLCPSKDGAFKQTNDKRWAHVICALWIPEVGFSNPDFLEPIDSIQNIPRARWKLCCYICKKKNVGACIQCKKASCYTAFHVTCAQNEGLFMEMKAVRANGTGDASYEIKKSAFCHLHTPQVLNMKDTGSDDGDNSNDRQEGTQTLTELSVPVTYIPNISPKILVRRMKSLNVPLNESFVESVIAFWKMKRQSRSGAPLLRRLQVTLCPKQKQEPKCTTHPVDGEELLQLIKIRQDFEKVRLLLEMVQKREKLKRSLIKLQSLETILMLQPFTFVLLKTLKQLQDKDVNSIFAEPVDVTVVTDYLNLIKKPMDFSTMQRKVQAYQYSNFPDFEDDFNLMLDNCLSYNGTDTAYYRIALEMRNQCGRILQGAKETVAKNQLNSQTGLFSKVAKRQHSKQKNGLGKNILRNHIHITPPVGNKEPKPFKQAYHLISIGKKSRRISFPISLERRNPGVTSRIGSDESDEENGIRNSSVKFSRSRTVLQHLKKMNEHGVKLQHCNKKLCVFKTSDRQLRSSAVHLSIRNMQTKVPGNLLTVSACSTPNFTNWPSMRKVSSYTIDETSSSRNNVPMITDTVQDSMKSRCSVLRSRHLKK